METKKEWLTRGLEYELQARDFYLETSQRVQHPGTRVMLLELAEEEARHVALFRKALAGEPVEFGLEEPLPGQDLGLAERLEAPQVQEVSQPADVLVVAMKLEAAAIVRYERWAAESPGTPLAELARHLAAEERVHKYRLESIYDEEFLRGN